MTRYSANSSVFWDITPYNKPEIKRYFGEHVTSIFRVEDYTKQETSQK
jgi:hypothetical protein